MRILWPIFAVALTVDAYWAKRIHSSMGMAYMRLLSVTEHKTDELKQVFVTFETVRWNALITCVLALAVITFVVRSKVYPMWIKLVLSIFWCVVFIYCLSPD